MDDKACGSYWFPKLETIPGINLPETYIVKTEDFGISAMQMLALLDGDRIPKFADFIGRLKAKCYEVGFPAFIRTGHYSGKHSFRRTCLLEKEHQMKTHVVRLVDESGAHDLPAHVWMIRRFLDLEHRFSAFEGLPISKERRYFIRDGAVLCHHPYWTNDVIAKWYVAVGDQEKELREICGDEGTPAFVKTRLPHDWEKILATLNEESDAEVEYLKLQAERIAKEFPGYWSVDFACEAGTGAWFVIDMAPGDESYHVEGCDHGKR